jgi:hypothetical protein
MGVSRSVLCVCVGVVIGSVVGILAPCREVDAGRRGDGVGVWWAPDSTWGMRLGEVDGVEDFVGLWERRPEKFVGLLMFEVWASEEGEWFWIRMRLSKVKRVTFTNRTKVVVTDREGKRVESEAVFFWPDLYQTSLYDSRRGPVVVTNSSVWRGSDGRNPTGCVKFASGSVRVGDIRSFEVVGAVEDTVQRGGQ